MDVVKNAAGRVGEASQPAAVSTGYRNYVLVILTLTYTLNFVDRQIIGILAVPLKAEFQLSDSEFGLLGGLAFALLYSTLAVPIAWLADRVSRVWIITIALSLWSGFTALCGIAGSYTQLFLFRMGVGIGEAGGVAPAYSLIADYFPRHQRARAMAVFSLGYPFGAAAGTLVGGLVAATYGWRTAFFVVGILGVVIAPLMRLTIRDPQRGGLDRVVQPQDGATVADTAPLAAPAPPIGETLRYLLQKPSFWLMAFACAASSVCGYGLAAWLPSFFIRSFGLTLSHTALYYSGITFVGGIAGIWFGGQLSDRFGALSRNAYALVPAIALTITIPCFLFAMNSQNILAALFSDLEAGDVFTLTVAFIAFTIPIALNSVWLGPASATTQHLVPPSMRATAAAMLLLINNLLGIAVGIFYFGWISDVLRPIYGDESLRYSIYSGMIFYVLAAVFFFAASRTLNRDWVE